MMEQIAEKGQMPEDEIKACEETTKSAQQAVIALMRLVQNRGESSEQNRGKSSDVKVQEELQSLSKSATETKSKLDAVMLTLRKQRIGLDVEKNQTEAKARLAKAEEALAKCREAECAGRPNEGVDPVSVRDSYHLEVDRLLESALGAT